MVKRKKKLCFVILSFYVFDLQFYIISVSQDLQRNKEKRGEERTRGRGMKKREGKKMKNENERELNEEI